MILAPLAVMWIGYTATWYGYTTLKNLQVSLSDLILPSHDKVAAGSKGPGAVTTILQNGTTNPPCDSGSGGATTSPAQKLPTPSQAINPTAPNNAITGGEQSAICKAFPSFCSTPAQRQNGNFICKFFGIGCPK